MAVVAGEASASGGYEAGHGQLPYEALHAPGDYRYDLSPQEVHEAIWDYMARTGTPQAHRLVGVILNSNEGPVANAARTRECQEFQAAFSENTPEWMREKYRAADAAGRRFLTVFDLGDPAKGEMAEVAGVFSIATHPPYMSLEDAGVTTPYTTEQIRQYHGIRPGDKVVDALTVAVARKHRAKITEGTTVMAMLEGMFVRVGMLEGWNHVVSMIDSQARGVLDAVGIPFRPMHGYDKSFEYCGSPETFALYGKFDEFGPGVAAHYRDYRWSLQRLRDTITFAKSRMTGERSRASGEAMKRLGLFVVARNVTTGRGVVDRAVLPDGVATSTIG